MVQIVWTPRAANDLTEIHSYISQDSRNAAEYVVHSILKRIELLQDFPFMGRIVPEFQDDTIREVFRFSYRIVYKYYETSTTIRLLTIRHGGRLIDPNVEN